MKINTTGIETDINLETAQRAFHAVSFSPEKRGQTMVDGYIETMTHFAQLIEREAKDERQQALAQDLFDTMREKYKRLYSNWIHAKSRCLSSMITGPANFPVRRAEKANQSEHNRMTEVVAFEKQAPSYIVKKLAPQYTAQEAQANDIDDLKAKIAKAESNQEFMKSANALQRKKDTAALRELFTKRFGANAETLLQKFLKPNYMNHVGYERFELTNNLANIKRMKDRLAQLESKAQKAQEVGEDKLQLNGLQVVRNFTEDRLQLLFDEKPADNVRALLKSHGFKWAPSQSAWQRKLTNNAIYSFKHHLMTQEPMKQFAVQ